MERVIRKIETTVPMQPRLLRVAAYARVSSGKDAMLHSLSAQVTHYSQLIQQHDGWQYCGVYSDEAFTGTKENREGFQSLLSECRAGNIDLVITKSISRFARNTVTLLQTVRELKLLGVDVYFEEQNIHTIGADGELIMTILASYAQEESRSASENQKWRIRKNFEEGKPWNGTILGYRIENGQYVVVPEEAAIVRRIFREYLEGYGHRSIAQHLNAEGITARRGAQFHQGGIQKILHNYCYTGNLLLQQTYRENHISKQARMNKGELPMYHATETHEAIISMEDFEAVQREAAVRAEQYAPLSATHNTYPFTGKIECLQCGKHYRRKIARGHPVWICGTFNTRGKAFCDSSKQIPEDTLMAVTAQVLGRSAFDEHAFSQRVKKIQVGSNFALRYILHNGQVVDTAWTERSRAESWTPEMKAAAKEKALQRRKNT